MNNTWSDLISHNLIHIKFTLYKIDNWDPLTDYLNIEIDGKIVFQKTFDNTEVGS
jgi:hypothetical protein